VDQALISTIHHTGTKMFRARWFLHSAAAKPRFESFRTPNLSVRDLGTKEAREMILKQRHRARVKETYDKQHEEGQRQVILVGERIEDCDRKVGAQDKLQIGRIATLPPIFGFWRRTVFADSIQYWECA
jgi:hypothetical protein